MELREPYKFQTKVINFIKKRKRAAILADPGTGKSLCSIRGLDLMNKDEKTLCVVPASLKPNWETELLKEFVRPHKVEVVSYERLIRMVDSARELCSENNVERHIKLLKKAFEKYDNLIVDESHYTKTYTSKRSQAIMMIQRYFNKVLFLTGSPTLKSNQDLFVTVSCCEPGKWGAYATFCSEFCEEEWNVYKREYEFTGYVNSEELSKRMSGFSIVIEKEKHLKDLPKKREHVLRLQASGFDDGISDGSGYAELFEGGDDAHISEIRREACFAKMGEFVQSVKARMMTDAMIVFCWHKDVGAELVKKLPGKVGYINGDVPIEDRYKLIEKYQDGKLNILVITIASGGTGLNIQRTEYVEFFEMPWTDGEIEQALSRAIRIGNKNSRVLVEYVILEDSIDEAIYYIAKKRRAFDKEVVGGIENQGDD